MKIADLIKAGFFNKIPLVVQLSQQADCPFEKLCIIPSRFSADADLCIMFSYKLNIDPNDVRFMCEADFDEAIQKIFQPTGIKVYAICKDNVAAIAMSMPWEKSFVDYRLASAIPLTEVRKDTETLEEQWDVRVEQQVRMVVAPASTFFPSASHIDAKGGEEAKHDASLPHTPKTPDAPTSAAQQEVVAPAK